MMKNPVDNLSAFDTYIRDNKEKLDKMKLDSRREVLWSFVLDIEGTSDSKRGRKRRVKIRKAKP